MSPWLLLALSLACAAPAAAAPFQSNRISVAVTGSGPDVVLIPGLGASRGIWTGTVRNLPGYRYHLVQVLGFAGTAPGGNSTGPVAAPAASEIARYISTSRLQRPAVVGHSMGGTIAMMLGARHSSAVGRVMVVDMLPSTARPFGLSASLAQPLAKLVGREVAGADRFRRELQGLVGRFGGGDWLGSRNDGGVVGRSLEELIATDLTPELPRIKAPLTVVYACAAPVRAACGSVSRVYTSAYARRPDTKLVRIDRSGHTIMWDQPAAFQATLKRFLSGQ